VSNATAARLGSSPLRIDWTGLHSLAATSSSLTQPALPLAEAWSRLRGQFDRDEVGFYHAPMRDELSAHAATRALSAQLLADSRGDSGFKDVLILGIGGSALGPICLLSALEHRRRERRLRFHFAENPDPIDWKLTLSGLDPESTLVIAVTKSGTTFETMAQLLLALEWLGKPRWKTHLVALTDPVRGDLRRFADDHGIRTLPIAPSIGGRFSVFSPVGLLAAELAGLDTEAFMKGARQVREHCEKANPEKSPISALALELIRNATSRPTHVCMPYSSRLRLVGDWFVQLWGESLGKDGRGFTPVAAVGATDQHSILQLLRDGPEDKITWFITAGEAEDPVRIPRAPLSPSRGHYAAFELLEGHTLGELLTAEYHATSLVMSRRGRGQLTLQLDSLDEASLGALLFTLCMLTSLTGTLWGINPFDQPGVEEGKVYIRESLEQSRRRGREEAMENERESAVHRLRRGRDSTDN
jgi:glucose-6-phosphate isomerase